MPVNEEGRLTDDDVVLAGRISASAADLGAKVDVAGLQMTQIVIDALVIPDIVRLAPRLFTSVREQIGERPRSLANPGLSTRAFVR